MERAIKVRVIGEGRLRAVQTRMAACLLARGRLSLHSIAVEGRLKAVDDAIVQHAGLKIAAHEHQLVTKHMPPKAWRHECVDPLCDYYIDDFRRDR